MDKKAIELKLEFDKALRKYKKLLQQAPIAFMASDREMDAFHNSVLLAKAEVDRIFNEALQYHIEKG